MSHSADVNKNYILAHEFHFFIESMNKLSDYK